MDSLESIYGPVRNFSNGGKICPKPDALTNHFYSAISTYPQKFNHGHFGINFLA